MSLSKVGLTATLLQLYLCAAITCAVIASFSVTADSPAPSVTYWSTRSPSSSSSSSSSYGRRYSFTAIMDSSERIFVLGGARAPYNYLNDVWLLQPNDWDAEGGAKWTCQTCGEDVANITRFEPRGDLSVGITTDVINATTGFPRMFVFSGESWLNMSWSTHRGFRDMWSSDDLGRTWMKQPTTTPFDYALNALQAQYNQRLGELFAITADGLYSINASNPVTWYSRDFYPFASNLWQDRVEMGVTQIPGFAGDKWIMAGGYNPLRDYFYNDVYIVDLSLCVKSSMGGARYTQLTTAATWSARQNFLVSSLSPLGEPLLWMYGPSQSVNNTGDLLWFSSNTSSTIGQNWTRVDNVTVNASGAPCQGGWPFPVQMKDYYDSFVFLDSRSRLILLTSNNNRLPAQLTPMNDTRFAVMILNATSTNAPGNLTRWESCIAIQNTTSSSTGASSSISSSTGNTGISSTGSASSSSSSASSSTGAGSSTGSSSSSSGSSISSSSNSGGSIPEGTGVSSSTAILGSSSSSSSSISGDSAAVAGSTGAGSATGTSVLPVDTNTSGSHGLSSGAVAAIVVGGLVGLLILMAAFARFFAVRRDSPHSVSEQLGNNRMHQLQEMQQV